MSAPPAAPPTRVLLVGEPGGLVDGVDRALRDAGHFVRYLRGGDAFSVDGDRLTVRPGARDDYRALAEHFRDSAAPRVIVHAHALADPRAALGSLALLAEALGGVDAAELVVLTAGAQEVTGDEALSPAAAALVGAARVVPQEHPHLRCRIVDVAPDPGPQGAARIAAEAVSGAEDLVAAWRGRHRWVRGFRAARPGAPAVRLREGGTYAVVGAAGASTVLARAAAEKPGPRVVLVAPADVDRAEGMDSVAADPADARSLARAFEEVRRRSGTLDGIVYAPSVAALAGYGTLADTDAPAWSAALASLEGELGALAAALEGRNPEFCLVDLPLTGVLGGPGQARLASAATMAEAVCAARGWTSVSWDRWNTGPGDPHGMLAAEAPGALDAVLALAGEPSVLVSTSDLEARIRAAAALPASTASQRGGTLYERPEMDVDYHPPTSEVEEQLAELWQNLLGIEKIGIHDDFFGLGGHSLLATQIVARVRDLFALDLPLQSIFEAPTIARYAELVEAAIIAELESLTDEEAAALMG